MAIASVLKNCVIEARDNLMMTSQTRIISQSDFCLLTSLVSDEMSAVISGSRYLNLLQEKLRVAKVVDDDALPQSVVALDRCVGLINEDTQSFEVFKLVLPSRANIASRRLSVLAPLGIAIIGCTVGQYVKVHHANIVRTFRVQDVLHSHLLFEPNLVTGLSSSLIASRN